MRRFIAYLLLAIAFLVGIATTFNPLFSKINAGREFTNSYEVVFTLGDGDADSLKKDDAEKVAAEMRSRLDDFAVEDYSVKVQGEDAVSVSFAADEYKYTYLVRYLKFSGNKANYALIGEKAEQYCANIFEKDAYTVKKYSDTVPYVIVPISDKDAVEQFLKTVDGGDEEEKSQRQYAKDGEDESKENEPNVYLVYDWDEADSFDAINEDPHIAEKVLMQFNSKSIWYEDSSEEHTELQYISGTANEEGSYDFSNLKFANLKARFLTNMFNASSYDVKVDALYVNEGATEITYNYNIVKATTENLLVFSSDVNVAMSITLISTFIAVAIISLLVIVFYRASAIAVIANTLSSIYLTFVLFITMGTLFNIPAIIGAVSLLGCSLFGQIYYLNRFKDEVYKGRSIRKANQEAGKKSLLVNIDAAVVFAFGGLMFYVIGGAALKPLGVMLFFGAIISLLMNLIVFRILMYLLTNTTSFQNKYNVFAIEEKDVPSVLEDKKSEYVAPYEKVNFTKRKKITAIVMAILAVASIVGISVFGAIKGSPLNVENSSKDYSALYVSITGDNRYITGQDSFNNRVLKFIQIDGKNISVNAEDDITYQKVVRFDSEEKQVAIEPDHIFRVNLGSIISNNKIKYSLDEGQNYVLAEENGIAEAISEIVKNVENITGDAADDKISVANRISHETVSTPSQTRIAIATAALIAGASLYFMLRFRISRGVSVLVVAASSSLITYGALVLTRLATTPISAIAMGAVALNAILLSAYYLLKEKELIKESKEELTHEVRSSLMKKAISLAATSTIIFAIVIMYIAINYFGFGLNVLSYLFADILFGNIVALFGVLVILGPLAMLIEKWLRKIKLPKFAKRERKQKIKLHEQKSSEPEERTYIGIND